ncbi:stage V sporulation protein AA [Hazenella coriacea]|uniref:Stage V sporulation protein AA n=1 Tax=Hazenella coriacea TaxID=1179467 RepID=A0A4R3L2N5_9BACL|nr:stage V sporulation protein AA [Hazenella coriacea]TCS93462.1 stage V sporulation protein AA [Hazenella coriacea]
MREILYLRLKKKIQAKPGEQIQVKDVCQMSGQGSLDEILQLPVLEINPKNSESFIVIDALDVIQTINLSYPELDLRNMGEGHAIIEIQSQERNPNWFYVSLVWLLLFIGSGLAIMNFHMDVSMNEVHQRLTYLLTGEQIQQPLWLQIPYSIGIGLGMILFFNHLFKKRFNEEPSPMELEMFTYQETIDQFLINDEKKKVKEETDGSLH